MSCAFLQNGVQIAQCVKLNSLMMMTGTTHASLPEPLEPKDHYGVDQDREIIWNWRDVNTVLFAFEQCEMWMFQHQMKRNPLWAESGDAHNERYKFCVKLLCQHLDVECKQS